MKIFHLHQFQRSDKSSNASTSINTKDKGSNSSKTDESDRAKKQNDQTIGSNEHETETENLIDVCSFFDIQLCISGIFSCSLFQKSASQVDESDHVSHFLPL